MNIMLGNLSVSQMEDRLGIKFPEDIKAFMKDTHCDNASNIPKGKWHCFDIPFAIVCGDMDTAQRILGALKDQSDKCKEPLRFALSN